MVVLLLDERLRSAAAGCSDGVARG